MEALIQSYRSMSPSHESPYSEYDRCPNDVNDTKRKRVGGFWERCIGAQTNDKIILEAALTVLLKAEVLDNIPCHTISFKLHYQGCIAHPTGFITAIP